MSKLRYTGPARPIATYRDPFPDSWLLTSFAVLFAAFVLTMWMWG